MRDSCTEFIAGGMLWEERNVFFFVWFDKFCICIYTLNCLEEKIYYTVYNMSTTHPSRKQVCASSEKSR